MPKTRATFKHGQAVTWHASQGTIAGTVERVITAPTDIKGHHAAASPEHPQVVVKSATTGAEAIHRPEALRARSR